MNTKNWKLYALYALMQVTAGRSIEPLYQDFDDLIFYDPTEECNNSTDICLLSFKHCTRSDRHSVLDAECHEGAKKDDMSWYSGDKEDIRWILDAGQPIAVYTGGRCTLKWQNNNPDLPTTVMWRGESVEFDMYKGTWPLFY